MGDSLHLQHNTIIMTAAAAAPKAKKAAKPKAPAAHPPYAAMIKAAIKALGDKKGSSRQAILKYVCANYKVDAAKAGGRVRLRSPPPRRPPLRPRSPLQRSLPRRLRLLPRRSKLLSSAFYRVTK